MIRFSLFILTITLFFSCKKDEFSTINKIKIDSSPQGAEIYINGANTELKTPYEFELASGDYVFDLKMADYDDQQFTRYLLGGEEVTKNITLPKSWNKEAWFETNNSRVAPFGNTIIEVPTNSQPKITFTTTNYGVDVEIFFNGYSIYSQNDLIIGNHTIDIDLSKLQAESKGIIEINSYDYSGGGVNYIKLHTN